VSPLVVVLLGTDHHPFDRLVRWTDAAAQRHPGVRFVVQHGTSRPPANAEAHDFLDQTLLRGLLDEASAVVCHGGPGVITEAREAGHVPLCVPRDPGLGEHVDGHQQRFATMMGEVGVVRDVRDEAAFARELEAALLLDRVRGPAPVLEVRDAARARAAAELTEVMTAVRPHGLRRWRHDG
jgi:UDP-N-acetylglucosamine transferase subunit ALG13